MRNSATARFVLLLAAALPAPALAQSVAATVTAATQLTVSLDQFPSGPPITNTLPAGTDLTSGQTLTVTGPPIFGGTPTASAGFALSTAGGVVAYSIDEQIVNFLALGAVGAHDTLLALSSPVPVTGTLTVRYTETVVLGTGSASVDIGNDGSVEFSAAAALGASSPPVVWQQRITVAGHLQIRTSTALTESSQRLEVEFDPIPVTATASAATQVRVEAGPNVDSRPAGTDLTPGLSLYAIYQQPISVVDASATFGFANSGDTIVYRIHEGVTGSVFTKRCGPHDTVLRLRSAARVAGVVRVVYSAAWATGMTASIDIGNDGSVEWTRAAASGTQTYEQQVVVDGTLEVRTSTSQDLSSHTLEVRFEPLAAPVGPGCVAGYASYYQRMSPSAMDLAGEEVVLDDYGGGFRVSSRPGTIQPIGSVGTPFPGPTGDDDALVLGALQMEIHSNCQVGFGSGNSTNFIPNLNTMLNTNPGTALYAWTDLDPSEPGSGQIWYEENGWDYQVTYDGVYQFGTTQPVTVQFRGNRGFNDHVIAFGPTLHTTGQDWLIGYSPGGPSPDPGPIDYSALTAVVPYVSREPDVLPLTLVALGAPVNGAPFFVQTINFEPGAIFHIGLVGLTSPGQSLGFLGLDAACALHASPDVLLGPTVVAGWSSYTWVPVDLSLGTLVGFEFYTQAATLDLSALSATTRLSNGLRAVTH